MFFIHIAWVFIAYKGYLEKVFSDMGVKLMNVNHVRLLTIIVSKGNLSLKNIIDASPSKINTTITSRLSFLVRYKLVNYTKAGQGASAIFYYPTESGIELIKSLKVAIEEVEESLKIA